VNVGSDCGLDCSLTLSVTHNVVAIALNVMLLPSTAAVCVCLCVCVRACVRACVIRLTCQLRAQRVRPCQLQVLRNRSSLACPTPNGRQFLLFQTDTQLPRSNSRCHFFNIGFVVRPVVQYYSWNLLLRSSITQGQVDYEQDVIALSLTTISTKKRVI